MSSGIFKVNCNDSEASYIGQIRRSVETRSKEHESHIRLEHKNKSAVAEHMMNYNHISITLVLMSLFCYLCQSQILYALKMVILEPPKYILAFHETIVVLLLFRGN